MLKTNDNVRQLCESLSTENKKYVLAVAQALRFTEQKQKQKKSSIKPNKAS